jgi:hypothetical protein
MKARGRPPLYRRIREILESARAGAARSVNTTQVVANWLIGREIIVVRYTLGPDQQRKIFASRYKLHLPSEAELRVELRREVRALAAPRTHGDAP